jgi:predicted PurR-regulated permease PerM
VLRLIGLVVAAYVLMLAVKAAQSSLILIFTAFFLALALNHPVHYIAKHLPGSLHGKRTVATAISFMLVVGFFVGFFALVVPPLVKQTQSFIAAAPALISDANDQNTPIGSFIRTYNLEGQIDTVSAEVTERVKNSGRTAFSAVGRVGSSLIAVLTILVMTFMMLIEGPRAVRFFQELVPKQRRPHAKKLGRDMYRVIRGFINGQVTLAALAAIVILPILFIMGVSYPIALVVVVFICGLIPMVGHTIGAVIVSTVALFTSPLAALIVLAYYILYQQIENYLIQPKIQSNSTDMSPLLVFISVVVGISFGGLFGGLFAIPVAGCIRILVLDFLENRGYIHHTDSPTVTETVTKARSGKVPKPALPSNTK